MRFLTKFLLVFQPQQEIDLNSSQTVTSERQTFYCVPVPGESAWVKEISFLAELVLCCTVTANKFIRFKEIKFI